jgi:hypothetical protein
LKNRIFQLRIISRMKRKAATMLGSSFRVILSASLLLAINHAGTSAEDLNPAQSENEIKATFLYNFANYIKWPDDVFEGPDDPLIMCVLGNNESIVTAFESMKNMKIKDRELKTHYCSSFDNVGECHILYICKPDNGDLAHILHSMKNKKVLTVSDIDGFAQHGGMIELINAKNKIRFAINIDASKSSGFEISSKLLRLAKIVKEKS